jgi:hypothetical protein
MSARASRLPAFLLLVALGLLAVLAPRTAAAAKGVDACTSFIPSISQAIVSPGTYCLQLDLSTSNPSAVGILVNSDDVVIDCNGHSIDGRGAGADTQATGITATGRNNVVVRNCVLRGFFVGIDILDFSLATGGHLIEDNLVEDSTYVGIRVMGDQSLVRRNRVFDTGGSQSSGGAFGIETRLSTDLVDNTIVHVFSYPGSGSGSSGVYAYFDLIGSGSIVGNRVRDVVSDGAGESRGIETSGYVRLILRDNDIVGSGGGYGIDCGSAAARARDNVISGFATAIRTCASGGGNVVRP